MSWISAAITDIEDGFDDVLGDLSDNNESREVVMEGKASDDGSWGQ